MTSTPPLSVVIPTYRRAALATAVVDASLAQIDHEDEVIVVDDGSDDGTEIVLGRIADPRLRIISQANQGAGAARNNGAALAKHDLILFIDDDEVPEPGCIEAHRRAHGVPGRRVVMGRPVLIVRHRGRSKRIEPGPLVPPTVLDGSTISLHRDDLESVGGFDPALRGWQDIELGIRLQKAGLTIEVAPTAFATHHLDRSYALFRRQRVQRGVGRAIGTMRHGVEVVGDLSPTRRTDRALVWLGTHSRVFAETVSLGLWGVVRLGGWLGSWRIQSLAASRAGKILLTRSYMLELRKHDDDQAVHPMGA